jgi:predicted TIM-barrel fold metal-dependent hydrolase
MYEIINCHAHIFTLNHVPNHFVRGLVKIARGKIGNKFLQYLLSAIIPIDNADILDRYAKFIKVGGNRSQRSVFKELRQYYPANTKFAIISVDMDFMGAGKAKQNFISQLEELAALKADPGLGDKVLPFICADPRRKNLLPLVKKYIEEHDFAGIKIYPALGFYPYDDRLDELYRYAISKNIPVISHCTPHGIFYLGTIRKTWKKKNRDNKIFYNGKKIDSWYTNPVTGKTGKKRTIIFRRKKKRILTTRFTHPDNYKVLLNKYNGEFKNLKINLAHLGGEKELEKYLKYKGEPGKKERTWYAIVKKLIGEYPHLYADVSYTLANPRFIPVINIGLLEEPSTRGKVLFGSDYYMAQIEGDEYLFSMRLRHNLGEAKYKLIAGDNPRQFFNGS